MKEKIILTLAALLLIIGGCTIDKSNPELISIDISPGFENFLGEQNDYINKLNTIGKGWDKEDVIKVLGQPTSKKESELVYLWEEDRTEGGYYIHTRIVFEDNGVVKAKITYGHISKSISNQ